MRVPLSVAFVWVLSIVLVALGVVDLGRTVVVVAFVTIGSLLGFRLGGSAGPTDSSTGSTPGPS